MNFLNNTLTFFNKYLHFITTSLFSLSTNIDIKEQINICLFMPMECILNYIKFDIDTNNDELVKTMRKHKKK
jgi:hypothetical protein